MKDGFGRLSDVRDKGGTAHTYCPGRICAGKIYFKRLSGPSKQLAKAARGHVCLPGKEEEQTFLENMGPGELGAQPACFCEWFTAA